MISNIVTREQSKLQYLFYTNENMELFIARFKIIS